MADFKSATAKSGIMVLDCMATWCGPCKVIAPVVSRPFPLLSSCTPQTSPYSLYTSPTKPILTRDEFHRSSKCQITTPTPASTSSTSTKSPTAQELGVRAMPTFIVFKDGEKVGEVVGANAKALEGLVGREVTALKA